MTTFDSVEIRNESDLPDVFIEANLDKIGREVALWVDNTRKGAAQQRMSLFDRSAYIAPDNPYSQMEIARRAVANDDVVSGVADVTESLAFQGIKWEAEDFEDADVFNQMATDLNLDNIVRQWWREEFTYSQAVLGIWWGRKQYKVRGYAPPKELPLEKIVDPVTGAVSYQEPRDPTTHRPKKPTKGPKRKKTYDIACPVGITFLDPQRVVPIGSGLFGQDDLAWQATRQEMDAFERVMDGTLLDPMMSRFFTGKYNPSRDEADSLSGLGVDPNRLLVLNPATVFRHCVTKPDYLRFPDVRLKGTFGLLDMKAQLMEADRVMLVGAANYILLIKKGTKEDPGTQQELRNLNENFKVLAKLPVIISDHRLEIQIITPAQDFVLDGSKYDTIDRRILNRVLGSLTVTSSGQRNESTLTVARGVARTLESRRQMIKRELEKRIARAVMEHPSNKGQFDDEPNLAFVPRNVQLDSDSQTVQAVMSLRTQRELSRETILEYFGFDQEVEAQRREYEEESGLDDIFDTSIPFNSPDNQMLPPQSPQQTGAQGGRPPGGGSTAQSPQAQTSPRTPSGNKKRTPNA